MPKYFFLMSLERISQGYVSTSMVSCNTLAEQEISDWYKKVTQHFLSIHSLIMLL